MATDPLRVAKKLAKEQRAIAKALGKIKGRLARNPHFAGFGVAFRKKGKKRPAHLVAVLFVTKKLPISKQKKAQRLPTVIKVGHNLVPTDVRKVPKFRPMGNPTLNRKRLRPVEMGAIIQPFAHMQDTNIYGAGTAGALVHDLTGSHYLLSAAHVLVQRGLDVVQPSRTYGGHNGTPPPPGQPPDPKDRIGSVRKIASNGIDGGYAEVTASVTTVINIGKPTGSFFPLLNLPVQKSGATTGVTLGRIDVSNIQFFDQVLHVWYAQVPQIFTGVPKNLISMPGLFTIFPNNFLMPGDSGSLVMAGPPPALEIYARDHLNSTQTEAVKFANGLDRMAIGLGIGRGQSGIGQEIDLITSELAVSLDL
jgi:hypothetical protein